MPDKGLRGSGVNLPSSAAKVGMPLRVFLYTLDQIAVMIDITPSVVRDHYVYFEGRSVGSRHKDLMIARNIAPAGDKPEWRVPEREFVRWLKFKGFRIYETGAVPN